MADTKKKENQTKSNFGHTEDEWGTEKKDSERGFCDIKERKKTEKQAGMGGRHADRTHASRAAIFKPYILLHLCRASLL